MSFLICKTDHFILDRRTITGSDALDDSAVERGSVEAAPDNFVGGEICISHVAGNLFNVDLVRCEGEGKRWGVSVLRGELREINGLAIEPWSGASLEPSHPKSQTFKRF